MELFVCSLIAFIGLAFVGLLHGYLLVLLIRLIEKNYH